MSRGNYLRKLSGKSDRVNKAIAGSRTTLIVHKIRLLNINIWELFDRKLTAIS